MFLCLCYCLIYFFPFFLLWDTVPGLIVTVSVLEYGQAKLWKTEHVWQFFQTYAVVFMCVKVCLCVCIYMCFCVAWRQCHAAICITTEHKSLNFKTITFLVVDFPQCLFSSNLVPNHMLINYIIFLLIIWPSGMFCGNRISSFH